jgi:hypothetical protein
MSDLDRQRRHWQAIAEQLGLAAEGESPEPQAEPPAPKEPEARAAASGPEESRHSEEWASPEDAGLPPADEPVRQTESAATDLAAGRNVVPRTEEEPAPRPKRGGRRGRREDTVQSRKKTRSSDERGEADAGASDAGPRRRGRGRKAPRAGTERPDRDTPQDAEELADADDLNTFGEWNVPSWNDLIASLYRPER